MGEKTTETIARSNNAACMGRRQKALRRNDIMAVHNGERVLR